MAVRWGDGGSAARIISVRLTGPLLFSSTRRRSDFGRAFHGRRRRRRGPH